jgi:thiamine-phosphate pyrophosphorylase
MTDRRLADPWAAAARLPPGAAVILRANLQADWAGCLRMRDLCRSNRLLLFVANDIRLALWLGADGLHLSEAVLRSGRLAQPLLLARRRGLMLSAAAHSRQALHLAAGIGADFALLSPVFPTASHPGATPLGPIRLASLCRQSPLPVIALGGIKRETARRVSAARIHGYAAIQALS